MARESDIRWFHGAFGDRDVQPPRQGIELIGSGSPEEFAVFLRKQVEEFARLAQQAGITLN